MPASADISTALTALEAPRVWSMLVSIFGDLAHAPHAQIDGPLLTRLTDAMGIKPEAVRVALHRLRNDGWIESTKSGRTAKHALTKDARAQRNQAAPQIYSRTRDMPLAWQLAIIPQGDAALRTALESASFVAMTPRIWVAHAGAKAPPGVMLSTGKSAPPWVPDDLLPRDLTAQLDQFLTALLLTQRRLTPARLADLSLTETALLRCLIVHQWRRLVLRHPYLPPALLGADWPGHTCRDLVCDLLDALPRPPLDALLAEDRSPAS